VDSLFVKSLFILLLFYASCAFADAPSIYVYTGQGSAERFPTPEQAARKVVPNTDWSIEGCSFPDGNFGSCALRYVSGAVSSVSVQRIPLCADGTAPNNSLPLNQQCSAPACPDVGSMSGTGKEAYSGGFTLDVCIKGCGFVASGNARWR
jgi:hypothetical protein